MLRFGGDKKGISEDKGGLQEKKQEIVGFETQMLFNEKFLQTFLPLQVKERF